MTGTTAVFTLPAVLTIATVEGVAEELGRWYNQKAVLCQLRGGQVEEIDAAGVQLLLAVWKNARKERRSLNIEDPSPVLVRALDLAGGGELFGGGRVGE